jgi:hypothetical protein
MRTLYAVNTSRVHFNLIREQNLRYIVTGVAASHVSVEVWHISWYGFVLLGVAKVKNYLLVQSSLLVLAQCQS